MAKLKVTWIESGITEEVESDLPAAEYKSTRFGTPASEVTVEEVVEPVSVPVKKSAVKVAAPDPVPEPVITPVVIELAAAE